MSDTITPITQLPVPCDFGPFFGGYCGKVVTIDFSQSVSKIDIASITIELLETAIMSVDLSTLVNSVMPIDWTKTKFNDLNATGPLGTRSFDTNTKILKYTPDKTPTINRTATFEFEVTDSLGGKAIGLFTINIVDKSPVLTATPITISGAEDKIYTIDITTHVNATNTTVNYLDPTAAIISQMPSEGSATIASGVITFTPSLSPTTTRTVTMKYKVTSVDGLTSESTVSVTLTDATPSITTSNISKATNDSTPITASILGGIVLKFDTFKSLSFQSPSEGSITVSGSNYTYTPDASISTPSRVITIPYTVTTTSGLTSTSNLIITVTDYNKFANTFWYGNSTLDVMTQAEIEKSLTSVVKSGYAGTYPLPSGSGVYKWVVYPKSWGETPTIMDAVTLMEIALDNPITINIDGVSLIAFRTYYQVNGAVNFKII